MDFACHKLVKKKKNLSVLKRNQLKLIVNYMADHIYKTKVYYEDTDAGGIVYYARYLHFIERARTEMIYDHLKLNHKQLRDKFNAIFVVRECNVKYLKSAKFEDNLEVKTKVIKKSPVRLNLLQEVLRKNEILVTAQVELAVIDSNGSVSRLPKDLLEKI